MLIEFLLNRKQVYEVICPSYLWLANKLLIDATFYNYTEQKDPMLGSFVLLLFERIKSYILFLSNVDAIDSHDTNSQTDKHGPNSNIEYSNHINYNNHNHINNNNTTAYM